MFLAWFPGLPERFGAQAIYALMDEAVLDAFGFPQPPRVVRAAVDGALRARAGRGALLPPVAARACESAANEDVRPRLARRRAGPVRR